MLKNKISLFLAVFVVFAGEVAWAETGKAVPRTFGAGLVSIRNAEIKQIQGLLLTSAKAINAVESMIDLKPVTGTFNRQTASSKLREALDDYQAALAAAKELDPPDPTLVAALEIVRERIKTTRQALVSLDCDPQTSTRVNGRCVPKCLETETRNFETLKCEPKCNFETHDLVNGQCVAKIRECTSAEIRNIQTGACELKCASYALGSAQYTEKYGPGSCATVVCLMVRDPTRNDGSALCGATGSFFLQCDGKTCDFDHVKFTGACPGFFTKDMICK